jgi:hypothetical protein
MAKTYNRINQVDELPILKCYRYFYFSALYRYMEYWQNKFKQKDGLTPPRTSVLNNLLDFFRLDRGWFSDKANLFSDFQEMAKDQSFLHWEEYSAFRQNVQPLVDELKKETFANLLEPKFAYNDKGLGVFDFSKASTVLLPNFIYYSIKHKKEVSQDEVGIKESEGKFQYYLKSDNSEVLLLPAFENSDSLESAYNELIDKLKTTELKDLIQSGYIQNLVIEYNLKRKVYSTVKKTFLYKENLPKPKRAIRILVYVGGNSGRTSEELLYSGFTAILCSEILLQLGYSVSIVALFGRGDNLTLKGYKDCPTRVNFDRVSIAAVELKKFSESLDVESLLACTAESKFFRGSVFLNWIYEAEEYDDDIDNSLGRPLNSEQIKNTGFYSLGIRDGLYIEKGGKAIVNEKSPLLYYLFDNIYSEEAAIQKIRDLILSVEDENRIMREKIYASLEI